MAAPRKYPEELRERAIRFALDLVAWPEKLARGAGVAVEIVKAARMAGGI